jgi:hypothetical protein
MKKIALGIVIICFCFVAGWNGVLDITGEAVAHVINGKNWAVIYSQPNSDECGEYTLHFRYIEGTNIREYGHQRFTTSVYRFAMNASGTAVSIDSVGDQIIVGKFYGDDRYIVYQYEDQMDNPSIQVADITLSDHNELIIFRVDFEQNLVWYSVGIVGTSEIDWKFQDEILELGGDLVDYCYVFSADIGGPSDDKLAFVYLTKGGYHVYRRNGTLKYWSDYTITVASYKKEFFYKPVFLDIALDRQGHCVWVQSEPGQIGSSKIVSQPNVDVFTWDWRSISSSDRDSARVSVNNGKAVTVSRSTSNYYQYTTLWDTTTTNKIPKKLYENYVYPRCPAMRGITDVSF